MGEANRRKATLRELVASEPVCVYCGTPNTPDTPLTLEHMPPRSMFRERRRPKGLEFASCRDCNNGTRGADLVASYIARLDASHRQPDWKMEEARARLPKMQQLAPGVLEELFRPDRARVVWDRTPAGLLVKSHELRADGPRLAAHLDVFAAKLAKALYRHHVGGALSADGGVETAWFLNAGLPQSIADTYLSIMPSGASLKQGSFEAGEQFGYRWNCDGKSIVAALVSFQNGLHVFAIATAKPEFYKLPSGLAHHVFTRKADWPAMLTRLRLVEGTCQAEVRFNP